MPVDSTGLGNKDLLWAVLATHLVQDTSSPASTQSDLTGTESPLRRAHCLLNREGEVVP